MQEIFLKIRYVKTGLSKSLKIVNFIFLSNQENKRDLELLTSQSSGYETSSEN